MKEQFDQFEKTYLQAKDTLESLGNLSRVEAHLSKTHFNELVEQSVRLRDAVEHFLGIPLSPDYQSFESIRNAVVVHSEQQDNVAKWHRLINRISDDLSRSEFKHPVKRIRDAGTETLDTCRRALPDLKEDRDSREKLLGYLELFDGSLAILKTLSLDFHPEDAPYLAEPLLEVLSCVDSIEIATDEGKSDCLPSILDSVDGRAIALSEEGDAPETVPAVASFCIVDPVFDDDAELTSVQESAVGELSTEDTIGSVVSSIELCQPLETPFCENASSAIAFEEAVATDQAEDDFQATAANVCGLATSAEPLHERLEAAPPETMTDECPSQGVKGASHQPVLNGHVSACEQDAQLAGEPTRFIDTVLRQMSLKGCVTSFRCFSPHVVAFGCLRSTLLFACLGRSGFGDITRVEIGTGTSFLMDWIFTAHIVLRCNRSTSTLSVACVIGAHGCCRLI